MIEKQEEKESEEIGNIQEELKKKTPWVVFVWAIGLIVTMFGIGLTVSASLASSANNSAEKAIDIADSIIVKANDLDSRVTAVEIKQDAQFNEVLRSLDRLERRFGTK